MLRLSLENLQPGMITAKNIYNANGNRLLGYNVTLDERLIARLANIGIDSVFVKNPYFDDGSQEILHEKTRVKTIKLTQNAFTAFRRSKAINLADLHNVVKMMVEDVIHNRNVLIHVTDIRTHDDYTFGHSINACLIATVIDIKMRLSKQELQEMAFGVILHDIGKMLVPPEVLNKKEALSTEE